VNKNPTDATVCRYLFTAKLLYMFRVSQHPGVLHFLDTTKSNIVHVCKNHAINCYRDNLQEFNFVPCKFKPRTAPKDKKYLIVLAVQTRQAM